MPTIDIPLFRPEALRPYLTRFDPANSAIEARPLPAVWADKLKAGRLDDSKETELLPEYLSDVFGAVLGYVGRPAEPYMPRGGEAAV